METLPTRDDARVKTVNFNGRNFETWKFSVNIALRNFNLIPIVDGTKTKPQPRTNDAAVVTNQEAIDKWVHDDNLAQHSLFNTCNEEQQRSLLTCTSAHAIWLSLTSRYQQNTAERRQSLGQELLNYKFRPDNGVRAHIEAIKLLIQQFKEAGGTMNEEDTQSRIINSLPTSYDSFITSWESVTIAERTLDTLTTRLMRQEEKMNLRSRGERSHEDKAFFGELPPHSLTNQAPVHFKSLPRGNNRPGPYALRNRNRFGGRNNKSGRCSYCQIFRHSEENCLHKNSGSLPCNFCKIFGHQEDDCYRKQRNPPAIKSKSGDTGYAADSNAFIERNGVLVMTVSRLEKDLYRLDILILSEDNAYVARSTSLTFEDLHRRFNHISYQTIIQMAHTEAVRGLVLPSGQPPTDRCHDCAKAKITRVAKRDNRTLVEGACPLLYSNKTLPLQLWAEAVNCVVYTRNRTLSSAYSLMTPFEAWYGFKPDISNLRAFGSEFYVLIPHQLRHKLDAKRLLCFLVGNSDTQKGDRYWDPTTGNVNVSRDVSPVDHHYEPRLPRPDVQKGVDVFPLADATPAGSPTDPATTALFDPATKVLPPPLNGDRVAMGPVDVAADPEPPGHLLRLRSSVLPGPVSFTE
ncbi:Copia (Gag-int-pol)-like protein, partial [Daphnia magna]